MFDHCKIAYNGTSCLIITTCDDKWLGDVCRVITLIVELLVTNVIIILHMALDTHAHIHSSLP